LEAAPTRMVQDEDIIQAAIVNNPSRETIMIAIRRTGWALKYAPNEMKNEKSVVLIAVALYGGSLLYASDDLRMDHEVVLQAVRQDPTALKFSIGGLNQSVKLLRVSGLWDDICKPVHNRGEIVLSTRFSLAENSSTTATIFALLMKQHPFFANLNVYSPNCWNKGTCDPNWTDYEHPCHGTYETCLKEHDLKIGRPQEAKSCWKYSFRHQLTKNKTIAMVQIVEYYYQGEDTPHNESMHIIGNGQQIETRMAKDVRVKVFRCFQPIDREKKRHEFSAHMIGDLAHAMMKWMANDQANLEEYDIHWNRELGTWWKKGETQTAHI